MKQQNRWRMAGRIAASAVLLAGIVLTVVSFAAPTSTISAASRANLSISTGCQALVYRSMLYPEGGHVPVNKSIYNKITHSILLDFSAQVSGDATTHARGSFHPMVVLAAEGYWEKEYITTDEAAFVAFDDGLWTAETKLAVNTEKLSNYIESMEKDLGFSTSTYLLEVTPGLSGEVSVGGKAFPLQDVEPIVLEYSNGLMTLRPSANASDTSISFPVVNKQEFSTEAVPQPVSLSVLWLTLTVVAARRLAIALILLPLFFLAWEPAKKLLSRLRSLPEEEQIDRHNRSRIISIRGGDALQNKPTVELQSFQKLATMAEQKDLPLFKLSGEESPSYLVIDTGMIYRYTAGAVAPQPHRLRKGGTAIESGAD